MFAPPPNSIIDDKGRSCLKVSPRGAACVMWVMDKPVI